MASRLAYLLRLSIIASIMWPLSASAVLGGPESSIEANRPSSRLAHRKNENPQYTVHELTTSTNVIHEYVSPGGTVFAVTWRGVKRPDLETLFGSYYSEYKEAESKQAKPLGRHASFTKTSRIVVARGGHMRDIHGRAYVPDLVPAGVKVEALK